MTQEPPAILVVDDDVDTCRNLSDILTDFGYRVDTAQDGPSALALVRQKAFDVALLDLRMPDMSGVELFREIRKLRGGTVGIIVTAYATPEAEETALASGARQVLAKPVQLSQLLGLVQEAAGAPLLLVVDDDPDLCANLGDLLRDRGYRVSLAHTISEAAEQLRDSRFTVVLIDMKLPHGDGGEVFRLVRQANPETRTVLITGHRAELEERVQAVLSEGADAVCYKPFDVGLLLATIERLTH